MCTNSNVGSYESNGTARTKGFITVATGDERYHRLAYILLTSYRIKSKNPMRFGVITDRKSKYTDAFDDVVLISNAKHSYLDKIDMLVESPYDETIFIDSDCIAYGDLNVYWNLFEGASCMSAFGWAYPLGDRMGWYPDSTKLGVYSNVVKYGIGLHGGIYYFRKCELLNKLYDDCYSIIKNYKSYSFAGFAKPADEPVIALAMGINQCKPVPDDNHDYLIWLIRASGIHVDFFSGELSYYFNGAGERINNVPLLHFGNVRTKFPLYQLESKKVLRLNESNEPWSALEYIGNCALSYAGGGSQCLRYYMKRLPSKIAEKMNR